MTCAARLVLVLTAIASFSAGLKAQPCGKFDVTSIKLNAGAAGGGELPEVAPGGRRLTARNQFLIELIMLAYDVSPLQISGIPSAVSQQRYDIDATCEQPMTQEQMPRLLQELLADRFHLAVHRELREEPVFALVLAKGGPKFHESSQQGGNPGFRQTGYRFAFSNARMSTLVGVLSQLSGRKVLDQTGLRGQYDFTLNYAPSRDGAPAPADGLPDSVFTALREQLGLSLDPQKSQVEFIVIDRLDRLTPN